MHSVLISDSRATVYNCPVNLKAALALVSEKQRAKVTPSISPGWPASAQPNEERPGVTSPSGSL